MKFAKFLLICLAAGILAGVITWTVISSSKIRDDATIRRIKQALILPRVALGSKLISRIDSHYSHLNNFADHAYPGWDQSTDKLKNLTQFTIKLLDFWATYGRKKSRNYPEIVESVVTQVVGKLKQADLSKVPWGDSWYTFSALVTRMLVMYEYVGDKPNLQRACHDQLVRITPSVGTTHIPSDSNDYDTMNIYFAAVPRLCSNYMFDPKSYEVDVQSFDFARVQTFLNFEIVKVDKPQTGVYQDHSWIHYNCVATYEILFRLYNFHERAYTALGHANSIRKLAKAIISKILHPQIPYRPLGLSGRNGVIYDNTTYWGLVPNSFGAYIMPYIGFGVYKTPDFLFYVRVQRPGIAAYITNAFETEKIFALAWIQLPKLYIRNYKSFDGYDATLTGKSLMEHPWLLLIDGHDYASNSLSSSNEKLEPCFVDQDSIDSFIGITTTSKDADVLFWKNKYKFSKFYGDCTITDVGMVWDTTASFMLRVENNSEHNLTFFYKAKNHYLYAKTFLTNNESWENIDGVLRVLKGDTKVIEWGVQIQQAYLGKITYTDNIVTFKADDMLFNVQTTKGKNTFVVRHDDKNEIVCGGSSSSDPEHSFKEGDVTMVRDKSTFMYYPSETH